MTVRPCSVDGCGRPVRARDLCQAHYMRFWHGKSLDAPVHRTAEVRFWQKVDKRGPGECWPWTGAIQSAGYGNFHVEPGRLTTAHRFSYELANGLIPEGMEPDHLCRNRACVNPAHLEAVTHRENVRRGVRRRNPRVMVK